MACLLFAPAVARAQAVSKTTQQPQKIEQQELIVVKEDPKKVEKGMTMMPDTIYHQMGDDLKNKKVTVTVIENKGSEGKGKTYTYTIIDSLQNNAGTKVAGMGNGKKMIIMQDGDTEKSDLPTPLPSGHAYRIISHTLRDPFAFDPADTTIVSYNKKDMGKGLEKITIVRKKTVQAK
jgi:hypothetical protein